MSKSGCAAPSCGRAHYAHGLCKRDYDRAARGRPVGVDITSPEARYEAHVDRTGGPGACHPWTGKRNVSRYGYGMFSTDGTAVQAHRWGYRRYVDALGDDEIVRHTCDNPPCQNPRHWLKGEQAANVQDMVDRDRQQQGDLHYAAKLTADDVRAIRDAWDNHRYRGLGRRLAEQYGVYPMTISEIVNRKTWRSVK